MARREVEWPAQSLLLRQDDDRYVVHRVYLTTRKGEVRGACGHNALVMDPGDLVTNIRITSVPRGLVQVVLCSGMTCINRVATTSKTAPVTVLECTVPGEVPAAVAALGRGRAQQLEGMPLGRKGLYYTDYTYLDFMYDPKLLPSPRLTDELERYACTDEEEVEVEVNGMFTVGHRVSYRPARKYAVECPGIAVQLAPAPKDAPDDQSDAIVWFKWSATMGPGDECLLQYPRYAHAQPEDGRSLKEALASGTQFPVTMHNFMRFMAGAVGVAYAD